MFKDLTEEPDGALMARQVLVTTDDTTILYTLGPLQDGPGRWAIGLWPTQSPPKVLVERATNGPQYI